MSSPIATAIAALETEKANLLARVAKVDQAIANLRDLFHLPAERAVKTSTSAVPGSDMVSAMAQKDYARANAQDPSAVKARILAGMRERKTVGWQATCRCTLRSVVPCVVLDPFAGAATTGMVCDRTGRDFIGIDLNHEFVEMGTRRRAEARRAAEASA